MVTDPISRYLRNITFAILLLFVLPTTLYTLVSVTRLRDEISEQRAEEFGDSFAPLLGDLLLQGQRFQLQRELDRFARNSKGGLLVGVLDSNGKLIASASNIEDIKGGLERRAFFAKERNFRWDSHVFRSYRIPILKGMAGAVVLIIDRTPILLEAARDVVAALVAFTLAVLLLQWGGHRLRDKLEMVVGGSGLIDEGEWLPKENWPFLWDWLVRLRWLGIVLVFVMLVIAEYYPQVKVNHLAVGLIGFGMALWNLILSLRPYLRERRKGHIWLRRGVFLQMLMDLVFLVALIAFSGRGDNPFVIVYGFDILLAVFLLGPRAGLVLVGLFLCGVTAVYYFPVQVVPGSAIIRDTLGQFPHSMAQVLSLAALSLGLVYFGNLLRRERDKADRKRRQAEQVIMEKQKLALIGELAAGTAHEIKNPIHGMQACLDLMEDEIPSLQENRWAKQLRFGMNRVNEVVVRMLDLGLDHVQPELICPRAVMEEIVGFMRVQARQKKVELELQCVNCDRKLMLDVNLVYQIVTNLVANAIHASSPGGLIVVTCDHLEDSDPVLRIRVADRGSGMNEDQISHFAEPFHTTGAAGTGFGLGTVLIEKAVNTLRGHLDVASDTERGTTVIVTLPLDIL